MCEVWLTENGIIDDLEDSYDDEDIMPEYCAGIMDSYSLEEEVMENALPELVRKVVGTLTPKEQLIIYLHYGFLTGEPVTLTDIGYILEMRVDRVSQIHRMALRKLRHPSKARKFRSWVSC